MIDRKKVKKSDKRDIEKENIIDKKGKKSNSVE